MAVSGSEFISLVTDRKRCGWQPASESVVAIFASWMVWSRNIVPTIAHSSLRLFFATT